MDFKAAAMGLAFAVMWSSAFTSARIIVQNAPPLTALSARFLISGLAGVCIAKLMGQSWKISRAQWRAMVIFGLCQNALYLGLNFMAMRSIEASLAGIMASTMPLLVAGAGWIFFRERLAPMAVAGLVAGVFGVSLIMGARLTGGADLVGVGLCALAVVSLTVATLVVRGASSNGNVLMIVGLQMLIGSAALAVPALAFESIADIRWSREFILAFAYTTVVPGLLATVTWFLLVNRIGAVRAAVYHFLTPFLGVVIAAIVLGEHIGVLDAIGVVIIATGIWAVQRARAI